MRLRRIFSGAALFALALAVMLMSGCGLFNSQVTERNVPDTTTGAFHFMVPAAWQVNAQQGLILLYASDKLPDNAQQAAEALKTTPSMIVLITQATSTTPVPTELTKLINLRADARTWKSRTVGPPKSMKFGDRPGYGADVTGVDANGVAFKGRFYLARTSGREVFVSALSPPDQWSGFETSVNRVFTQWFWQLPAKAELAPPVIPPSGFTTKTPAGKKPAKKK